MRIKILIGIIVLVLIGTFIFWKQGFQISDELVSHDTETEVVSAIPEQEERGVEKEILVSVPIEKPKKAFETIIQEVPFTSQAPTGNWKDLVFQNACEEAALLMADKWVRGKNFETTEVTAREIQIITQAEKKYFPKDAYDLSAEDTLFFAQKYFPEMRISSVKNVTKEDLKNALYEGNIVIIPANGQKLKNPNFTARGPLYHTLLVRGYDPATDAFIVNDPGTRKGNGYRYASDILFAAMQNYETGYHGKLFPDEKVMLVIRG